MKNFKIKYESNIYVKGYTREFINLDIPDTYYFYNGTWVHIIDRKYGNHTIEYCELPLINQIEIYNFILNSTIAFYKYASTWDTSYGRELLIETKSERENTIENFIERLYREAFIDDDHLTYIKNNTPKIKDN